jgi:hypothetical protein
MKTGNSKLYRKLGKEGSKELGYMTLREITSQMTFGK